MNALDRLIGYPPPLLIVTVILGLVFILGAKVTRHDREDDQ